MMKKNTKLLLLAFAFAAVYNALLFSLNSAYGLFGKAFWIAYGFIMFAWIAAVVCLFAFGARKAAKDYAIFGIPSAFVSLAYAVVQFLLGTVLMIVNAANLYANLIPQLGLALVFLVVLIPVLMAKNAVRDNNADVRKKVNFIRRVSDTVAVAASLVQDETVKAQLILYADDIKYSDPMSDDSLSGIENQIAAMADYIKQYVSTGEDVGGLIAESKALLAERNMRCKALK